MSVPRAGRGPARAALVLLLAASAAGCGLPEKARNLFAKPTPTPLPTPTPVPAPPLKLEFAGIREERVRGNAGRALCQVDVLLVGTKRREVESARVVVKRAVDDLGTSLALETSPSLDPVTGEDAEAPVVLAVPLKLAPRKARAIAEVSGEIELYVPNADPGALVAVPELRALAGKPVAAPSLAANGVEVAFASAAEAEALPAGPEDVVLKVSDPKKRIEGFYFVDGEGTAWRTNQEARGGFLVLSSQAEPPGPGWGLQVRLMTPGTLRRYRFALEDVPLP